MNDRGLIVLMVAVLLLLVLVGGSIWWYSSGRGAELAPLSGVEPQMMTLAGGMVAFRCGPGVHRGGPGRGRGLSALDTR